MTPEDAPPRALHTLHPLCFEGTLVLVSACGVEATEGRDVPGAQRRASPRAGDSTYPAQLQLQPAGDALLAIRIDYMHGLA